MAESKAKSDSSKSSVSDEVKAAGAEEVQEKVDKELEQGFSGTEVDPIPNEAYSVQSGPDSPTVVEIDEALADRPNALKKGQVK
ncbi:MAG: hypothetical protein EHM90_02225 [Chloroflexi bacterium]|nr:MAG: hypothetical protein EHM90_02225 [Chloroflexota bacterium]